MAVPLISTNAIAGTTATAKKYNDLRTDVVNVNAALGGLVNHGHTASGDGGLLSGSHNINAATATLATAATQATRIYRCQSSSDDVGPTGISNICVLETYTYYQSSIPINAHGTGSPTVSTLNTGFAYLAAGLTRKTASVTFAGIKTNYPGGGKYLFHTGMDFNNPDYGYGHDSVSIFYCGYSNASATISGYLMFFRFV